MIPLYATFPLIPPRDPLPHRNDDFGTRHGSRRRSSQYNISTPQWLFHLAWDYLTPQDRFVLAWTDPNMHAYAKL
jgi:hypothetical protein